MTPEERAYELVLSFPASLDTRFLDSMEAQIAEQIRQAVEEKREECARKAETWREDPYTQPEDCPGCLTAYTEGMDCGAPRGIARAIRRLT